jgi:hypothetical protein
MIGVRPIRWLAFVAVAIAAALMRSESARAAEQVIVALDYEASPSLRGCPETPQLEAMIAGPLGYAPFRADAPRQVTIRITPSDRGIDGSIEWRDHLERTPGQRRFATPTRDCAAMARTLAFALTVELQMLASEEEAAARTAHVESPPAEPNEPSKPDDAAIAPSSATATTATRPPPAAAATPAAAPVTIALGTGLSAAMGFTPGGALGARVFVSARKRRLGVELDLDGTLPSTTAMAAGPDFSHYALATTAAGWFEPGWFSACALAQAARLTIRGVGVDTPMTASGWAFAAGLRAAATWPLGDRLFVRARAEALAALTDWTVTLNHEAAWTRPRVAAGAGVDLGVRFR